MVEDVAFSIHGFRVGSVGFDPPSILYDSTIKPEPNTKCPTTLELSTSPSRGTSSSSTSNGKWWLQGHQQHLSIYGASFGGVRFRGFGFRGLGFRALGFGGLKLWV